MKTNTRNNRPGAPNFHGIKGPAMSRLDELRRTLSACLLWEDGFYEDGAAVADRIAALARDESLATDDLAKLAIEARNDLKLRHAPLWLTVGMSESPRHRRALGTLLPAIIQRTDELPEFLSLYWKGGKRPLAAQIKKGLAAAFRRFNAFQLAKYDRDAPVKLRDVLFLCHAKPANEEQAAIWKQLVDGTLPVPDTWETAVSAAGSDAAAKNAVWRRLLDENKLGALALLRNLRNLQAAKVPARLVEERLATADVSRILPFRFIAANRNAGWPALEPALEAALFKSCEALPRLLGTTAILVDVSDSMNAQLSAKSDMTRIDAACGLAMVARECCERVRVFAFSNWPEAAREAAPRRGFALAEAIAYSGPHRGTLLGRAVTAVNARPDIGRLIVVTDEESHDTVPGPRGKGIMINVSTDRHMVGWGPWTRIAGFSENVFRFLQAIDA